MKKGQAVVMTGLPFCVYPADTFKRGFHAEKAYEKL
jgi:hypothetical protein